MKSEAPTRIHKEVLPTGYKILWYELKSVLGRGGFGITYLAQDTNLDKTVAIKEYFPSDVGSRESDETVHPMTGEQGELYSWGLERFIKEARILAKFQHDNIMRVLSVFEQNNTAYIVMEYEQGKDLAELYKETSEFTETQLSNIFIPLLDGLTLVHEAGFIHRDIKPANIYIRSDGSPVLLDFGAARQAVGERTTLLTSLVTAGYAPFEQYNNQGDEQGAWSDIYSLGATLYLGVTNKRPVDALARGTQILNGQGDPYEPASELAADRFSQSFLLAVDRALMFRSAERPQNLSAWREMLLGDVAPIALPEKMAISDELDDRTVLLPGNPIAGVGRRHVTERPPSVKSPVTDVSGLSSAPPQKKMSTAVLAISVTAVLGIGGIATYLGMSEQQDEVSVLVPETFVVSEPVFQIKKEKEIELPIVEEPPDVSALMAWAKEAHSVGRLIRPKGDNALEAYREILSVDSTYTEAMNGIDEIVRYYKNKLPERPGIDDVEQMKRAIVDLKFIDSSLPFIYKAERSLTLLKENLKQIDQLLADAESYLAQGDDVVPPGVNAFDSYQDVIALDKHNREAKNGIKEIQHRYEVLFYRYIGSSAFDEATQVLSVIERIAAGTQLEQKVNERLSASGLDITFAVIARYKNILESKDKKRLDELTEMSEWRQRFLPQFFDQYASYSIGFSDIKYIRQKRKGIAKVKLTNLINNTGEIVMPGAWGEFEIEVARNNSGKWLVYW